MFESIEELIAEANNQDLSLAQFIIQDEIKNTEMNEEKIIERLTTIIKVMRTSLEKSISEITELPIKEAIQQSQRLLSTPFFLSKDLKEAIYWAMSIAEYSSGMGVIVACPTAGSSGVFPSTLLKAQQMLDATEEELLEAFTVGAEVGAIIGNKATLSGSEGGCQAEVGVASGMAAAAITYMAKGTGEQIKHSIALALTNLLGLVCDPVAGLVISPCIKRNTIGVMNAFLAAEMALSGVTSIIPVDEVIDALRRVGRQLPYELKETGLGGIASSPTAKRIKKELYGNN